MNIEHGRHLIHFLR